MHEELMRKAIAVAEEAYRTGCPPYGAIGVHEGSVIGTGHNTVEVENDPTAHSEVHAIRDACKHWGADLAGCDLYTVFEPCPMCEAAIVWARIRTVELGAPNTAFGAAISRQPTIFDQMQQVHRVVVVSGVLQAECEALVNQSRSRSASDGGA